MQYPPEYCHTLDDLPPTLPSMKCQNDLCRTPIASSEMDQQYRKVAYQLVDEGGPSGGDGVESRREKYECGWIRAPMWLEAR